MAAKARYTRAKLAIAGGAAAAVVIGAGYFAGAPGPASAEAGTTDSLVAAPAAADTPATNLNITSSTQSGASAATPAPAKTVAPATVVPRAKKSRGS
jgi:hypothetical protein